MLISDRKEFIFVHNYKVAGSSIRTALKEYCQVPSERLGWLDRQLVRLRIRDVPTYPPKHAKAEEIRDRFPKEWEEFFTFGFVRNPWSWQVSLYFYMLQNEDHWFHDEVKSMDGFEEYIEWRVEEDCVLQSSFFCDENGEFIVDFIGRLENIQTDFQQLCERIGVNAKLPHKNKSSHKDYRSYYDRYTEKLVEENFEEDIRRFRYSFEGVSRYEQVVN